MSRRSLTIGLTKFGFELLNKVISLLWNVLSHKYPDCSILDKKIQTKNVLRGYIFCYRDDTFYIFQNDILCKDNTKFSIKEELIHGRDTIYVTMTRPADGKEKRKILLT